MKLTTFNCFEKCVMEYKLQYNNTALRKVASSSFLHYKDTTFYLFTQVFSLLFLLINVK